MIDIQKNSFHCPECIFVTVLEHDGEKGVCQSCGTIFYRHECAGNGLRGFAEDVWLTAATAASGYACPGCVQVIRIAQAASRLPGLSREEKALLQFVAYSALGVGVYMFLDKVFGAKRGRA